MRADLRALVPGLVVLALLCVVAIASTGSTSSGTDRVRPPSTTLLDTLFTLALLAIPAGAILLAYGLMQRKEIRREIASGRYRRTSVVGWLLFVFAFTALAYWRIGDVRPRPTDSETSDVIPTDSTPQSGSPTETDVAAYEPRLAWIPLAAVLLLVAAGVTAYVVSERRARRSASTRDALVEEITAALDDTLDDLRAEPDPRRAVIAAYARLERVLAGHGFPRSPAETEEEYLARLLRSLQVSRAAARRLTDLFERAKFSQHAVDVGMKQEAIDALEQLRDELRRARDAGDGIERPEIATGVAS